MKNIFKWFFCQKYFPLENYRGKINVYTEHKNANQLWKNDRICGIKIIPIRIYRNRKSFWADKLREGK